MNMASVTAVTDEVYVWGDNAPRVGCFMPILILAVVAFLAFNILVALLIWAEVSEKRYEQAHKSEYPPLPHDPILDEHTKIIVEEPGKGARWKIAG